MVCDGIAASMHRNHSFYLKVIKAIYQNFLVMQMLHNNNNNNDNKMAGIVTRILRTIWQKPNMNNNNNINNNTLKPRSFKSNNIKRSSDNTTEQRPYLPIRSESYGSGLDTKTHSCSSLQPQPDVFLSNFYWF